MTLRYTVKLPFLKEYIGTKKVDSEDHARKVMAEIKKNRKREVSNFKLYDPMENKFIEL